MFAVLCLGSVTDQVGKLNPRPSFNSSGILDKFVTSLHLRPLPDTEEITHSSKDHIRASRHPGNDEDQWWSNFFPLNQLKMLSK